MSEERLALQKAIDQGDVNLIFLILFHLDQHPPSLPTAPSSTTSASASTPPTSLLSQLLQPYPELLTYLSTYYDYNISTLNTASAAVITAKYTDILLNGKQYHEAGLFHIRTLLHSRQQILSKTESGGHNSDLRLARLREIARLFSLTSPNIGHNYDSSMLKSLTEDEISLLETQQLLDIKFRTILSDLHIPIYTSTYTPTTSPPSSSSSYTTPTSTPVTSIIGLTLTQTLSYLYELSLQNTNVSDKIDFEIQKIIKKFLISEKTIYYIRIQVYSHNNAFNDIYKLSLIKRPPIGYLPFARICIQYNRPITEIEMYIGIKMQY